MNDKVIRQITFRTQKAIEDHVFPGCVIGTVNRLGMRNILPFGKFTYEKDAPPVEQDSIFDVATVTKTIPVACLLMYYLDQGKLSLEDPVIKFLPEFNHASDKDQVQIKHLLTNTLDLDLPGVKELKHLDPDQILTKIYQAKLSRPPGEKLITSNLVGILMGLIIEEISREKLDLVAEKVFFKPLGMTQTTFHPQKLNQKRILPTEIDQTWRKRTIQGEVHDEGTSALQKKYIVGSSGIFSTVPNMLTFLEMILNRGELNSKRFFSKRMVKLMQSRELKGIKDFQGLGWLNYPDLNMPKWATENTIIRYGFTGCLVADDLQKEIGIAIFCNQSYPHRKDMSAIYQFRNTILRIILSNS